MSESPYLKELNEAQCAAVEYLDGPELVIAGAGSGKTRVITYKIVRLLENGVHPARILALTFTNKAAGEMRQRISEMVGEEIASRLWMGTFHSVFSRLLRRHADRLGFPRDFTIYDASDSKSLIRTIIRDLKLNDKYYRPSAVAADISFAKNQLMSPDDYAADAELMASDRQIHRERFVDVFRIYRDRCRIAGAMDFDDLLYYTNVLLRDNPDLLEEYRRYFAYILVDEYQDTNFAQHLIVGQLAGEKQAVCVVGDDAQSIYSFRGANIRNILELNKTFPKLRIFKLEENYRSTRKIIGAANSLIAANDDQIRKDVYSRHREGDPVELIESYNDYEEALAIASRIVAVRRRLGLSLNSIAVLYRTNAQSRVIEEALRNRNISYRVYGGLAFYQRKEIKDAISYFRLSVNPNDDEALTRIINTPRRGIGDTTVGKLRAAAVAAETSIYAVLLDPRRYGLSVNRGTLAKLDAFTALLKGFVEKNAKGCPAARLANHIIESTGLLKEYLDSETPEDVSKRENLLELLRGVDSFTARNLTPHDPEPTNTMSDYLAEISLLTDQDEDDGDDKVTLMTIHSAKGLEFDAVFVAGVEEGILPSDKARDKADIEEERRLLYVAITRARQYCLLSYATRRMINGSTMASAPSRFLLDISWDYLRPLTGTRLKKHAEARTPHYQVPFNVPPINNNPAPKPAPSAPAPSAPVAATQVASDLTVHVVDEIKPGMRIFHNPFGEGTVVGIDTSGVDAKISVDFDGTKRTLLLKFARFKILSQ